MINVLMYSLTNLSNVAGHVLHQGVQSRNSSFSIGYIQTLMGTGGELKASQAGNLFRQL